MNRRSPYLAKFRTAAAPLGVLLLVTFFFWNVLPRELAAEDAAQGKAKRPNIILIMADDMGRDWVSCYGAAHKTPNLDRLASEGMRYETAWCMPICTPTRVTLLTGMYPFRHGWTRHYDVPRWGGVGFRAQQFTTFAKVLKDAGYSTAIGGKWQINNFRAEPDALEKHGFDEHCIWTGAEKGHPETHIRYWNGHILTNGKRSTEAYGPDTINRFLVDYIRRHTQGPFLVYYPMLLPHGPLKSTPFNKDNPPDSKKALYAGYIDYVDHLVGNIIRAVDDAGLKDRTVIFFTGDNGSVVAGSLNGRPYNKGKGRRADWGAHVPFVVRAPGLSSQRGVRRDLIDFTDILPTFAELAGAKVPKSIQLDGSSMVPSLKGEVDASRSRAWIYSQLGGFRMVRDREFLLDSMGGFYHLAKDPLQTKNLMESMGKDHAERRKRLESVLDGVPKDAPGPFPAYQARHGRRS